MDMGPAFTVLYQYKGRSCSLWFNVHDYRIIITVWSFYKPWGTVQIPTNNDKGLCYKIIVKYFRHTLHVSNGMLI